jgi:hypothetical protein
VTCDAFGHGATFADATQRVLRMIDRARQDHHRAITTTMLLDGCDPDEIEAAIDWCDADWAQQRADLERTLPDWLIAMARAIGVAEAEIAARR